MYSETAKVVPVLLSTTDFGAASDLDSINMANYHKATFIYSFGACGGAVTFTFNSGTTEGAKTTAVIAKAALGGAAIGTAVAASAASCDVLGAWQDITTSLAITAATKMVVCEVRASSMASGHNWLTGTIASASGIVSVVAILEPRYASNMSGTCLK
jgi:hypothetical protein